MSQRGGQVDSWKHDGQVLILVAIGTAILFAFAAMAVDVGLLLSERRGAQNAADAAAMAVARAMIDDVTDEAELRAMAVEYAAANGFEIVDPDDAITFDIASERVTVDISHDVGGIFLGAFYDGDWSVGAHAVAALDTLPSDYALLTLREDGPGVNMIGNVDIHIQDGSAMSNSSMSCNGNTTFTADQNVDSHEGFSTTGNCSFTGVEGENPNAPRVEDPMLGTPEPPKPSEPTGLPDGECTQSGNTVTCTAGRYDSDVSYNGNLDIVFEAGTYHFDNAELSLRGNIDVQFGAGTFNFYMENRGIHINGNTDVEMSSGANSNVFFYFKDASITFQGNTSLEMASGIYYFDGDDFGVSGNQEVSGDDLLLFFDRGASFNHAGNASFDFTASADPLYPGMPPHLLFFAAPGSNSALDLRGNTGINFQGITYMPDGIIDFRGNPSGVWARGQVIVHEVEFRGNGTGIIQYHEYLDLGAPAVWLIE